MSDGKRKDDLDFLYNGGFREGHEDRKAGKANRADAAPASIQDSAWARGYRAGWKDAEES
jgi:hypothetical protein